MLMIGHCCVYQLNSINEDIGCDDENYSLKIKGYMNTCI